MMIVSPKVDEWLTADEASAAGTGATRLGQNMTTADGKVYVCVKLGTGGVTGDGYVCTIDEAFEAVMASESNDVRGDQIGVAEGAGAAGDYGWLQVYGAAGVRTAASAGANIELNFTDTAGELDDDTAAIGVLIATGITTRAATGGAAAVNATGFLTWPTVGVTAEEA
jgi:hypothetical protein